MEIQTTIKELPQRIKSLNISPETSIRVIIDELKIKKRPVEKGRWAKMVEKINSENILDKESGEALRDAVKEFRGNFQFRKPPHFKGIEDES